jgi:hypothetical protein
MQQEQSKQKETWKDKKKENTIVNSQTMGTKFLG